jgi:hypothetical protein
VAGKAHKASAITYGEAKEGAVEAHNFSSTASVTMIHSRNNRKRDAKSVALLKMLAKSVYSIDTSKVTEDETEGEGNDKEEVSNNDGNPSASKRMVIEGMQIVVGRKKKAMLFETESMNEDRDDNEDGGEGGQKEDEEAGESDYAEEEDLGKEEDLTERMKARRRRKWKITKNGRRSTKP